MTNSLAYGTWAALLVPAFVGLAVAVTRLVDKLREMRREGEPS